MISYVCYLHLGLSSLTAMNKYNSYNCIYISILNHCLILRLFLIQFLSLDICIYHYIFTERWLTTTEGGQPKLGWIV